MPSVGLNVHATSQNLHAKMLRMQAKVLKNIVTLDQNACAKSSCYPEIKKFGLTWNTKLEKMQFTILKLYLYICTV